MRRQSGYVLISMVAGMAALLGFAGLAIDVGYVQWAKTRMQTAADAAAVGAVQEYRANGSSGVVTAARGDAALNGFTHGSNSVTVTVNQPPSTGSYTSDSSAVEVIISQDVKTFFMSTIGFLSSGVRARSVARQGSSPDCLYVLSGSANNAFSASGGVTVQVNCGVFVNSSSNNAISVSGGSRVNATSISAVGNYSISGGSTVTPLPVTGAAARSDPLANLAAPTVGACTFNNYSLSGGAHGNLTPGVYCGGISLSGGSVAALSAGTYILKGGGLSVSGGSSLSGTGVTFYNSQGTGFNYGPISISGGTTINLSAPTTGALAGILFFQDRSVNSNVPNSLSGGSSTVFNGALYFSTTPLNYSGGSSASGAYTILITKTVSFSGGTVLNNDYSSLPAGSPVKGSAMLSE